MTLYTILIIALALSLDAFGVALSIGLNCEVKTINKACFCLSFGFFQFLFAFLGAFAGVIFNTYIASIPSLIGGIVIAIVGALMIKEGMEEKEECILLKPQMYAVLGISVSIDALVVGFTALNTLSTSLMLPYTILIGVITFILCIMAFILSKFLHKIQFICKYADYIGGVILILFGLKMIFL